MKMNKTTAIKMVGWLAVAVGGFISSWAADKEAQQQNDDNFKEYIERRNNEKKHN